MKLGNIKKHRPIDGSDIGFSIPGVRFRWISARVAETRAGRPWTILFKENMPDDLIKHIESYNPGAFKDGGNTIRRGDLTLGYASEDAANAFKAEIDQKTALQAAQINHSVGMIEGASVQSQTSHVNYTVGADGFKKSK